MCSTRSSGWKRDRFDQPADYLPSSSPRGAFGLIGGELTKIRILFAAKVAWYLQRRR